MKLVFSGDFQRFVFSRLLFMQRIDHAEYSREYISPTGWKSSVRIQSDLWPSGFSMSATSFYCWSQCDFQC